jgi:hypothetical protein
MMSRSLPASKQSIGSPMSPKLETYLKGGR